MPKLWLRAGLMSAMVLVAGCAYKQGATAINNTSNQVKIERPPAVWVGRMSLQVQGEPPQAFFAAFELTGQADRGELTLTGPLGSIVGILRWSPGGAFLEQGGKRQSFASTDELLLQTTGAAVPLAVLFDWLAGVNTPFPGWAADLSQQSNGRISAKRSQPTPQADLRIVLDK